MSLSKINSFDSDFEPSRLDRITGSFLVPIVCERSTATHCSATRSTWVLPLEMREGWKAGRRLDVGGGEKGKCQGGKEGRSERQGGPKDGMQDENQRPLSSPCFFLRLITNHFILAESG